MMSSKALKAIFRVEGLFVDWGVDWSSRLVILIRNGCFEIRVPAVVANSFWLNAIYDFDFLFEGFVTNFARALVFSMRHILL